jgi:hypothetical protein
METVELTYEQVQGIFTAMSDEFREAVKSHCDIVETKARNLIESRWNENG